MNLSGRAGPEKLVPVCLQDIAELMISQRGTTGIIYARKRCARRPVALPARLPRMCTASIIPGSKRGCLS